MNLRTQQPEGLRLLLLETYYSVSQNKLFWGSPESYLQRSLFIHSLAPLLQGGVIKLIRWENSSSRAEWQWSPPSSTISSLSSRCAVREQKQHTGLFFSFFFFSSQRALENHAPLPGGWLWNRRSFFTSSGTHLKWPRKQRAEISFEHRPRLTESMMGCR